MISQYTIPVPNPAVVGRIVSGEAVLVLPTKGQVKVLNEAGARIWSLIDGARPAAEIIQVIHAEFAVSVEDATVDTLRFLEQLAEREIITFSDSGKE